MGVPSEPKLDKTALHRKIPILKGNLLAERGKKGSAAERCKGFDAHFGSMLHASRGSNTHDPKARKI